MPKDYTEMTIEELAEIGIVPGMGESGDVAAVLDQTNITAAEDVSVSIGLRSASGCNKSVCQSIVGKGLKVESWTTSVPRLPHAYCSFASFWRNGDVIGSTQTLCGNAGDTFIGLKGGLPANYADGSVVCSTWLNTAGKPCHTIHR